MISLAGEPIRGSSYKRKRIESPVSELPAEIISLIFSFLSIQPLLSASEVCVTWRSVVIIYHQDSKVQAARKLGMTGFNYLSPFVDNQNSIKWEDIVLKVPLSLIEFLRRMMKAEYSSDLIKLGQNYSMVNNLWYFSLEEGKVKAQKSGSEAFLLGVDVPIILFVVDNDYIFALCEGGKVHQLNYTTGERGPALTLELLKQGGSRLWCYAKLFALEGKIIFIGHPGLSNHTYIEILSKGSSETKVAEEFKCHHAFLHGSTIYMLDRDASLISYKEGSFKKHKLEKGSSTLFTIQKDFLMMWIKKRELIIYKLDQQDSLEVLKHLTVRTSNAPLYSHIAVIEGNLLLARHFMSGDIDAYMLDSDENCKKITRRDFFDRGRYQIKSEAVQKLIEMIKDAKSHRLQN